MQQRGEGNQQTVQPVPTPGYVYLYQGEDGL
jgi:26S proteasome regulatory subunit N13